MFPGLKITGSQRSLSTEIWSVTADERWMLFILTGQKMEQTDKVILIISDQTN